MGTKRVAALPPAEKRISSTAPEGHPPPPQNLPLASRPPRERGENKKGQAELPVPRVPTLFFSDEELRTDNSLALRGFDSIERNRETRFVAVRGVFVQHAFPVRAIDRR